MIWPPGRTTLIAFVSACRRSVAPVGIGHRRYRELGERTRSLLSLFISLHLELTRPRFRIRFGRGQDPAK